MSNYKDFAVDLARKAGKIIRDNHGIGMNAEWKNDATPLTVTDQKVNQLVLDEIEKKFPTHSIIAEEGSNLKESEYAWVCDPIDGTVPFSHGWPTSVFSLALTKNGESILGVSFDPYLHRMTVAERGKGATINDTKVSVSSATSLKNSVVDMEIWKGFTGLSDMYRLLIEENCHPSTIRSMSYGGMLVACGEIVAMFGTSIHPWDGAATKLIVEEAGGKVTNLYGEDQLYNGKIKGVLATNGLLHEKLLKMMKPLLQ